MHEALLRRVTASTGERQVVSCPFTGEVLAEVPLSDVRDVDRAVTDARRAQRRWARTPLPQRTAMLLRLHDLVLERRSEILDLIQLETGKARASAYEEVADIALVARHYARRAGRYLAPRRVRGLVPGLSSAVVHRRPHGVVGVVAPWNYPLVLSLGDAIPALVAGNAVVVKPDPQTALTTAWASQVLHDAGLPPGLLGLVVGGAETGRALVDAVDQVVFTGATATGRRVAEQAGRRLVPVTLELGGKNALYVADDADPTVAAEGAVRACFSTSGQLCVSVERLLLHESVADAFLDEFLPRVAALRLGAGLDYTAEMGSLTTEAQLARVREHVDDAVTRGARVLAGGRPRGDLGPLFHEPTVLADVPPDARVASEETFGPVVVVQRVTDDDAAVAAANDTEYGLTASVWTSDVARGRRIAARLEVGAVSVNEGYPLLWGSTAAPIGGVKASGLGRRNGVEAIEAATWTQTIGVQRGAHVGLGLGQMYGLPAEDWTALFTRVLRVMRTLRMP